MRLKMLPDDYSIWQSGRLEQGCPSRFFYASVEALTWGKSLSALLKNLIKKAFQVFYA